jgi:hypothetical protein
MNCPGEKHVGRKGRVEFRLLFMFVMICSIPAFSQHVEIGVFGSYGNLDLPRFPNTAVGLGGRLNVNLTSHLVLEGEASYDFKHPAVEILSSGSGTFNVTTLRLGVIHGNGGFKVQTKGGSYFLFFKGGVMNFRPESQTTSLPSFISGLIDTSGTTTQAVFYPGGGIGFHAGLLGIRVDAGDEMYWDNGTHHNLRITFGPTFRF